MAYRSIGKALPRIGGQSEEKPMKQKSFLGFLGFQSDNLKSKTCTELNRRIQNHRSFLPTFKNLKSKIENLKLVGLVAIAVAFALCGAVVEAQQTGKVLRIGFLDSSTASGSAGLVEAFLQELRKLGWI